MMGNIHMLQTQEPGIDDPYITVMFPYPSGSGLHIGHWYNYAVVDSYANIQRYKGANVFQPFGYDAFGLPAENYAKKIGGDPKTITYENISNFRNEIARMNTSFDEKLITCDESYQKRTQWLFTKLLEHGKAYKANRVQDYCPSCETVLAREQVINSKCERCSTTVEQKELNQWFFKITDYKDRLIVDLDKTDYPDKTKKQQRHWLENLTDWCVSRQRKWGCPIPIDGETDTLDTFVDSSFYTIEYCKDKPVDIYVGGNEHACMHLIYARFICKFLFDIGYIDFDEPFKKVIHQGMILNNGEKMSKSKGNTIDPMQYSPTALRMYLMFINHYFDGGSWTDGGYSGCVKFIKRWNTWMASEDGSDSIDFEKFEQSILNQWAAWKTNKVVSEFMIFYNTNKQKKLSLVDKQKLMKLFHASFVGK